MLLVIARHGNTFEADDTPVWVGAKEDLALTEAGLEQSRAIGRALRDAGAIPDRILAGPLKRTRTGAALAGEACGFVGEVEIDDRLREIDYGVWGGKTDAEIAERWGEQAIRDWRERDVPPSGAGWSPSPATLKRDAEAVFAAATRDRSPDQVVLIVTSNGVLRYFHPLMTGLAAGGQADRKVKTGRWCAARVDAAGVAPLCWNAIPSAASLSPGAADATAAAPDAAPGKETRA